MVIRNAPLAKKRGKTVRASSPFTGYANRVTLIPADLSRLAPDAFFARAAERLSGTAAAEPGGDHVLNPGMSAGDAYKDAAVLIPILGKIPLSVLFTLRTPRLSAHAGQVAFPGGKIDPSDADAAAAAIREAEEEIGLDRRSVSVVGALDPYLTGTGYRVVPVVGRLPAAPALTINHDEVAEIFEVPLAYLMTPGNMVKKTRLLGGRERHFYELAFDGHIIWGATAGIIMALYQRMFG
jgi:8-oxo-dGTP pyrophosphatase MutT (NUDIX family)